MVNDNDVRELFEYMSSVDDGSSGGSSDPDPWDRSFVWDPEDEVDEGGSEDDVVVPPNGLEGLPPVSDDSEDELGRGVRAPNVPIEFEEPEEERDQLTKQEIALLRKYLQDQIKAKSKARAGRRRGDKRPEFKVPKEHPVYDGGSETLEIFIMDMQLVHENYTMGRMGDKHNPSFITKLLPYFKPGSGVELWFKMYASQRRQSKKVLSWNRLVRDLRKQYGIYDRPEKLFESYWDLKQTGSVQDYIARKNAAALLAKDLLSNQLLLFGFVRGLQSEVEIYVKLQKPLNIQDAQKHALTFENSNPKRKLKRSKDSEGKSEDGERRMGAKRKRKQKDSSDALNETQRTALSDLRALRKQGCYGCGKPGHIKDKCEADHETRSKHMLVVKALKDKINGST